MAKLVYNDAGTVKVLRGQILSQDNLLIQLKTSDGAVFSIGKSAIISVQEANNGTGEGG